MQNITFVTSQWQRNVDFKLIFVRLTLKCSVQLYDERISFSVLYPLRNKSEWNLRVFSEQKFSNLQFWEMLFFVECRRHTFTPRNLNNRKKQFYHARTAHLNKWIFFFETDRTDLSFPPVIASINAYGTASDFLAPGDRLHQIDGISTIGLTNNHVLSILHQNDGPAVIEIEYCLPDYSKSLGIYKMFLLFSIIVWFKNKT